MKNLLFVTCLLFITGLSNTPKLNDYSIHQKLSINTCGSCSAAYGLGAQKNYNQLQLNWQGYVSTYSYGGYYNYYNSYGNPTSANFSGSTGGTQITLTIPPSTYSLTYRVTSNCSDGSTTESSPFYIHF
jgi:hypothetical protein